MVEKDRCYQIEPLNCVVVSSTITTAAALDESPCPESCPLSNVMDAPLVAPPAEEMGIVRAREILESMKLKRESFSNALQSSRQLQHGVIPENPFRSYKQQQQPTVMKPPFSSEEETDAITKQLNLSLQEKRERLLRMTTPGGGGKTDFLKEISCDQPVSVGGSPTSHSGDGQTDFLKETVSCKQQQPAVSGGGSHESLGSDMTHETLDTTLDTTGTDSHHIPDTTESSSGSPDASDASDHDRSPSSVTSKSPTLDKSREAFVEKPAATSTDDPTITSTTESVSVASTSCSVQEYLARRMQATTVMRPLDEDLKTPSPIRQLDLDEDLKTPPSIRRVGSWDVSSRTQLIRDLDIPTEIIRSHGSFDSVMSNSKSAAVVSSRPTPICLSTQEGRAAYIASLYAEGRVKKVEPPASRRELKQSPGLSPNRTSFLKPRSSQNSVSSPSTLSSQDLESMYSPSTNGEVLSYFGGIYNSPPRNQTQRSPSVIRPTAGSSRRERPGNQICVASYSPSNMSTRTGSSSSDMLDLSVVLNDQATRRKHLASLKVARTPAISQLDDSDFIFSDESSFDCSTDSNTSGWVSAESGLRDSFMNDNMDHSTDDDWPEDSILSLTPAKKSKGVKSKVNRKYVDASSVKPILLGPQKSVDDSCGTMGGMYCLALASGMTKKTPIHVRVVMKRAAPKGLRLSNDFRCGANGGHYDLALRSGLDLSIPRSIKEEREDGCWEGRGGLYDLAILSGLQEAMEARTPFTVQIGAPTDDDEDTVASERKTDYECGAGGSLSMAMESGATYTAVGSMYYMASRSGFFDINRINLIELY
jgi:hypothetical protein